MRIILVFLFGLVLVGCSSNNIAKNKTTITSNMEFLKINEKVCSQYKSTDDKIYGCGTSTSKSFELAKAKSLTGKGKPVCILLHTEMGNGVDFMMHTHAWHGKAPSDVQLESALAQNPATLGDY